MGVTDAMIIHRVDVRCRSCSKRTRQWECPQHRLRAQDAENLSLRGDGTHERGVMVSMSRKPEGGALLQGERPLIGAMKMKRKNFGQPWIKHVSGKAWADSLLLYSFLM